MAKKQDSMTLSDYRISKIHESLAKRGRCEVICANKDERDELRGFHLENDDGVELPIMLNMASGQMFSTDSRLFVVTGVIGAA
jgi:hypothetical protein